MGIRNSYSFVQKVQLAYWLIRTKLIDRKARLIRFPIDIRGRRFIHFGDRFTTGKGCRLEAFSEDGNKTLYVGNNVQINDYVHICAMKSVRIGNDVLLAGKIYISDNSHGFYGGMDQSSSPEIPPIQRSYSIASVIIEDNVWIGENACVLPGSHIGRGVIIGANSVVKGIIPPYTIVVGTPAHVVKRYDFNRKGWFKTDFQGNFLN